MRERGKNMVDDEEDFLQLRNFMCNLAIVDDYITLKYENGGVRIYVLGEEFIQCKFLLLNFTDENLRNSKVIESIDEAAELLDHSMENDVMNNYKLSPKEELMAHCSNLQAWVENGYDTRLLHRNLAFPLLKRLSDVGVPQARRVFKDELAKRLESGEKNVIIYLVKEKYTVYFSDEEKISILEKLQLSGFKPDEFIELLQHLMEEDLLNHSIVIQLIANNFSEFIDLLKESVIQGFNYGNSDFISSVYNLLESSVYSHFKVECRFCEFGNLIYKLKKYFNSENWDVKMNGTRLILKSQHNFSYFVNRLKAEPIFFSKLKEIKKALFNDEILILKNIKKVHIGYNFTVLIPSIATTTFYKEKIIENFEKKAFSKIFDTLTQLDKMNMNALNKSQIIFLALREFYRILQECNHQRIIDVDDFYYKIIEKYHDYQVKFAELETWVHLGDVNPNRYYLSLGKEKEIFSEFYFFDDLLKLLKGIFFPDENIEIRSIIEGKNQTFALGVVKKIKYI